MSSGRSRHTTGSDRRKPDDREEPSASRRRLNEYFIEGEGINREVLQSEICRFLGPEATSRPAEHQGARGYMIKAFRPFTTEMLKDLREQSAQFEAEKAAARKARSSGREGSHDYKRSPRGSNQNIAMDYETSKTRQSYEPLDSRHGGLQGYGSAGTPYGQEVYGLPAGYNQPPPQGYGGPPSGGYDAPYAQVSYPPGYSMSQQPAGMTAPAEPRYQPSDPRYGGQPPYGYGAGSAGGPGYYPPAQGYPPDTQMDMGHEPPRQHYYGAPPDRGGTGGQRDHGGAMTGMISPSGDPYNQAPPFQRQQPSPYDQSSGRGGYSSRQPESYPSGGRRR